MRQATNLVDLAVGRREAGVVMQVMAAWASGPSRNPELNRTPQSDLRLDLSKYADLATVVVNVLIAPADQV